MMIVALHGLLLIFRRENREIPLIYLDHAGKLYFSKVRIFLRPAMVVFQQPYLIYDVLVYATLLMLIPYYI